MKVKSFILLAPVFLTLVVAGCSTAGSKSAPKPAAVPERGWIGGKFEIATRRLFAPEDALHTIPAALTNSYRDALLVTDPGSNSPVRLAGILAGDLILEINRQPLKTEVALYRIVDRSKPGATITLTTWRDGQTIEREVPVGREKFTTSGKFDLLLPLYVEGLRLWPLDSVSLWLVGYGPGPGQRHDLDSVKAAYVDKYSGGKYEPDELIWHTWVAVLKVDRTRTIVSQEIVAATSQPTGAQLK